MLDHGTADRAGPAGVVAAFDSAYADLALVPCSRIISNTTLTLNGNGPWLFKVGTTINGSGALTGTDFNVVMTNGGNACDVTWWVRAGATMTTSQFIGTILAGAAITVSSGGTGSFHGRALAKAAVSIKGGTLTGCTGGTIGGVVVAARTRPNAIKVWATASKAAVATNETEGRLWAPLF